MLIFLGGHSRANLHHYGISESFDFFYFFLMDTSDVPNIH